MELVHNCLRVQGGIIVPVYNVEPEAVKRLSGSSVLISVKSYGLDMRIDEIVVPIPEFMLEFIIDNNTITFYRADNDRIPVGTASLDRDPKRGSHRGKGRLQVHSELKFRGKQSRWRRQAKTENRTIRRFPGARYCTLGVSKPGLSLHSSRSHRRSDNGRRSRRRTANSTNKSPPSMSPRSTKTAPIFTEKSVSML